MTNTRQKLLVKITIGCVGLYLLTTAVIEPFIKVWKTQGERITELRRKVDNGEQLLGREKSLRERWNRMKAINLSEKESDAESAAVSAIYRWARTSQISISGYNPKPWQNRDDGSKTYECQVTANGTQAALGRFLFELESDAAVPVSLEYFELTAGRDARGAQLALTARITFLRFKETANGGATP